MLDSLRRQGIGRSQNQTRVLAAEAKGIGKRDTHDRGPGPIGHVVEIALGIGGGQVELGAESAVASGGKILSGSADPAWPSMSAAARPTRQSATKMLTSIGPRAVVCTNAVVLPGCHLGEGAILAAGGVATCPIPAGEVWGGAPARKLRDRCHGHV